MPYMNDQAEWCSGIAGAGVHWQGGTIWAPGTAGGAQWYTRDLVIGGRFDGGTHRLASYNVNTAAVVDPIFTAPLVEIVGSGQGHWAVLKSGPDGVQDSIGRFWPGAGLGAMGPDGSYALRPSSSAFGWDLLHLDGTRVRFESGDASTIQNYGNRRLTWQDGAGAWKSLGVPAPLPLIHPSGWFKYLFVGSEIWQLYQEFTGAGRLLLHPRGDPYGYVLQVGGNAFRPDGFQLSPGIVRLAWSLVDGDAFANIATATIDLAADPRTRLSLSSGSPSPSPSVPAGCT